MSGEVGQSFSPIEALDLICKRDAGDGASCSHDYLEWIAFGFCRDRNSNGERCLGVVFTRRKDEKRPTSGLLSPAPRVEGQPDNMSDFGHVGFYHRSAPRTSSKIGP